MKKMSSLVCQYCGKKFKEKRYLEKHHETGKECLRFRGVLFICLRCSTFHTTKIVKLEEHLQICDSKSRITDVFKKYQQQITDLRHQLEVTQSRFSSDQGIISSCNSKDEESEVLDTTFGEKLIMESSEIYELFRSKFEIASKQKQYSKYLRQIKVLRRKVFGRGDMAIYIEVLKLCVQELYKFLTVKEHKKSKIQRQILQHFTALDLRFLRHEGYEKVSPDGSLLQELDIALSYIKHPAIFKMNWVRSNLLPEIVGLFPVKTLILRVICQREPTYCYFGDPSLTDPYQFYQLTRIDQDNTYHWNMDCRAQNFVIEIRETLLSSFTTVFRAHYYNLFNDNELRENFIELSAGLSNELSQIIKSMKIVSDANKFSRLCQQLIIDKNIKHKNGNDKFNLVNMDPIQNHLDSNPDEGFEHLFDNLSPQSLEIIREL